MHESRKGPPGPPDSAAADPPYELSKTRAILADTIKRSEMDICKALIGHYVEIQNHNEEALCGINQTIEKQLRLKEPDMAAAYDMRQPSTSSKEQRTI